MKMTKYLNKLFITAAIIGLSASIPVSAANSFQEVADNNSRVLRFHEKAASGGLAGEVWG